MIGSVKYTDEVLDALKPAAKNRIADGVKGVIKSDIADNVDDIGKAAVKNSDEIKEEIIRDGSHIKNGILKPNITYQTGEHEYIYKTNERALISDIYTDDLKEKIHEGRLRHNRKTYGKRPGDHAGHLFADRFGGSPELDNLVSQTKLVNQSEFAAIENKWHQALKKKQKVTVNIKINYPEFETRPSSFDIRYTIDGEQYKKHINN